MSPIRTAVIGVGKMGQLHARTYANHPDSELVAVVDSNSSTAERVARQHKCRAVGDFEEILDEVDAVSIAVPTVRHREVAGAFIERGVHVLLEKPITNTVEEAEELIALSEANRAILQVGHIERFNAAIRRFHEIAETPVFIEAHRLGPFDPRVRDIGVVMDLMIHDLDIILSLVGSEVVDVDARGCPILTNRIDIASARLTFANGCVANITASRVTPKKQRKIRIFQEGAYFSIDYAKPAMHVYRVVSNDGARAGEPDKKIKRTVVRLKKEEPIRAEIDHFLTCVAKGEEPQVKGEHAQKALRMAIEITNTIMKDYDERSANLHHSG